MYFPCIYNECKIYLPPSFSKQPYMSRGAVDYTNDKMAELRKAEKTVIKRLGDAAIFMTRKGIIQLVLKEPASRFYISVEEAKRIINTMERGDKPKRCGDKLKMCNELFVVFNRLKEDNPGADRNDLIVMSVHSPASGFFLTERTVQEYLYKR